MSAKRVARLYVEGLSDGEIRAEAKRLRDRGFIVRVDGSLRERLVAHSVPAENRCVLWVAYRNAGGYGRLCVDGRLTLAHRAAYELHKGPIPDGMHSCHICDTPACINPDHLFLGTDADNVRDRDTKGRRPAPHGTLNPCAKLTPEIVAAIRTAPGMQREIAAAFGISQSHVSRIRRGYSWGRV